mmetsp:Transcript_92102/g.297902  ORF Transcript_92102/g.297902 Transcript_92102/m.297902 type:complete len:446 (+) Transcript_92102:97-1434(+)
MPGSRQLCNSLGQPNRAAAAETEPRPTSLKQRWSARPLAGSNLCRLRRELLAERPNLDVAAPVRHRSSSRASGGARRSCGIVVVLPTLYISSIRVAGTDAAVRLRGLEVARRQHPLEAEGDEDPCRHHGTSQDPDRAVVAPAGRRLPDDVHDQSAGHLADHVQGAVRGLKLALLARGHAAAAHGELRRVGDGAQREDGHDGEEEVDDPEVRAQRERPESRASQAVAQLCGPHLTETPHQRAKKTQVNHNLTSAKHHKKRRSQHARRTEGHGGVLQEDRRQHTQAELVREDHDAEERQKLRGQQIRQDTNGVGPAPLHDGRSMLWRQRLLQCADQERVRDSQGGRQQHRQLQPVRGEEQAERRPGDEGDAKGSYQLGEVLGAVCTRARIRHVGLREHTHVAAEACRAPREEQPEVPIGEAQRIVWPIPGSEARDEEVEHLAGARQQ